jgi:hypothetical protein
VLLFYFLFLQYKVNRFPPVSWSHAIISAVPGYMHKDKTLLYCHYLEIMMMSSLMKQLSLDLPCSERNHVVSLSASNLDIELGRSKSTVRERFKCSGHAYISLGFIRENQCCHCQGMNNKHLGALLCLVTARSQRHPPSKDSNAVPVLQVINASSTTM